MQTYFAGLEPAPVVRDKRHGSVLEGWRVSAVCEAPIERKASSLEKAANVLAVWNEFVVRHPAYSPDQECFVVFCVNTRTRAGWCVRTTIPRGIRRRVLRICRSRGNCGRRARCSGSR